MAKGLKELGVDELKSIRRRTLRQLAYGRIKEADCTFILNEIDLVINHIQHMEELPEKEGGSKNGN